MRHRHLILSLVLLTVITVCQTDSNEAAVEPQPTENWLHQIQASVRASEYQLKLLPASHLGHEGLVWQAVNRAHRLRLYFDEQGVEVMDRTRSQDPSLLRLELKSWGRPQTVANATPGRLSTSSNHITLQRPGIEEWYVNDPSGLEHGFLVAEPPPGRGSVIIELQVIGGLASLIDGNVRLRSTGGRLLNYHDISAFDHDGQQLEARLEVPNNDIIRLVVDDRDANYPINIDPFLTAGVDAQIEGDQERAYLGASISSAGDVNGDGFDDIIVSADVYDSGEIDEGAVFVFHGSPTGISGQGPIDADTRIEGNQIAAKFGFRVACAGDVNGDGFDDIAVGAPLYDKGLSDEGILAIYLGGPDGITGSSPDDAHALIESNQAGANLGSGLGPAGDVNGDGFDDVIVGAEYYTVGQADEGAAFIFHGSASGISSSGPAAAATRIEANQASARLGRSVTTAGDVNNDGFDDVIIGVALYDNGETDEGVALVFLGSPGGVIGAAPGAAHALIEANQGWARLGGFAAGAGDVNGDGFGDIIIGAALFDDGETDEGIALIYHGSDAGITSGGPPAADAQLAGNQAEAWFGFSVSTAGDVNNDGYDDVVVGASRFDHGEEDEGGAFVFRGSAEGIGDRGSEDADDRLEVNQAGAWMGHETASAGDVNGDGFDDLLVGAIFYDYGQTNEGAMFVYHGSEGGLSRVGPADSDAALIGDQQDAIFGFRVAEVGDVNGDGFADVGISAPLYDRGEIDEGVVFIFHGSTSGIDNLDPAEADAIIEANQAFANLGESLNGAGDVNGDGFDDVIVGAPMYDGTEVDEGVAFVFNGSSSGIGNANPNTAAAMILSGQADARLGNTVDGAGDVNGDGFDDVIIGALLYDGSETDEGLALIFHGSAAGITGTNLNSADGSVVSGQGFARFGKIAAGAGDVNGDGFDDVIMGAYLYDMGETDEGAALIAHGGPSGITATSPADVDTLLVSGQASAWFGQSAAGAGDVNGDGFDDVIIGSPLFDAGQLDEGAAFVMFGSSSGISADLATANARLESDQAGADLGWFVGPAGDLDGDGFDDVAVGAPFYDHGQVDEGTAAVYFGSPDGITARGLLDAAAVIESNQANAWLGFGIGSAGDVNGDGFDDLIVGAHQFDGSSEDSGIAFIFYGSNQTPGCSVRVLGPNGGESWRAGAPATVSWSMNGADCSSEVAITLLSGGSTAATIASPTSNTGSFTWNIPGTVAAGSSYRVSVADAVNPAYGDQSDANFVIEEAADCTLNVTSPNGGESFSYGDTVTLRWTQVDTGCGDTVDILLTSGGNTVVVVASATANSGSFSWSVPIDLTPGAGYRIMIVDPNFSGSGDDSDGTFTVVAGLAAAFNLDPANPVVDQPVQFTDGSTGPPTGWDWDFGDGSSSNQQNPSHSFILPQTYDVCLTVSLGSARSTTCRTIGVNLLSAKFVFSPPQPVVGEETRFADWSLGEPITWSWNFGDGTNSTERHPSHFFNLPGTYEVCQNVVRDVAATVFCRDVIVVEAAPCGDDLCQHGETAESCPGDCAPAACGDLFCHADENFFNCPQDCSQPVCGDGVCELGETTWGCSEDCPRAQDKSDRASKACTSCALPAVVGGIAGSNDSFWLTEAMLLNPAPGRNRITIHYTPDDPFPSKSYGPFEVDSNEAGFFSNFVDQFFGESANGSIRIEAEEPIIVVSRTFNDQPGGTYGQLISAWENDQVLGSDDTGYVLGVVQNVDFRTNLVVQEVTGKKTNFVLKVFDAAGYVGERALSVEPYRKRLWPFRSGGQGLGFDNLDDGYVTIEVVSGGRIVAMGSIIDNSTGDPRTVAAVDRRQILAPLQKDGTVSEAHYLVAAIAHAPGLEGSIWRSGVDIQNPFSTAQEVRLEYHPDGRSERRLASVWIEPSEQRSWQDIYEAFPGAGDGKGSLHVKAPLGVIVNSTTYNQGPNGTFGQFIPGLSGGDLFADGEIGWLVDLQNDTSIRTNLGFAELDGIDTRVRVTIYDISALSARALGSREYVVPGSQLIQPPAFREIVGRDSVVPAAVVKVTVSGGGRVYIYASKIDNETGDPTFIPAQRPN